MWTYNSVSENDLKLYYNFFIKILDVLPNNNFLVVYLKIKINCYLHRFAGIINDTNKPG